MSVQVLSSDYIANVKPEQVEQWVKEGKVTKNGNQYYANAVGFFPESCFVKGNNEVAKVNNTGTTLEKTTSNPKGEAASSSQTSYSVNVSNIIERMGLNDEELKTQFKSFLANRFSVSDNGEISFQDVKKLNSVLAGFAEQHKANFVDPKAQKYVEFTEDSAPEIINSLKEGDSPAIQQQPTSENGRKYAVRDLNLLNNKLSEQVGDTTYEATANRKAQVDSGVTTTSTTKEEMVKVPDNLHDSRAARKKLEKDAKAAYAELIKNADDTTENAINLYVAERKYGKQIDKKMQELSTYTSTLGGTKDKKIKRDGADIIKLYIDEYADPKAKKGLNDLINEVQNSSNEVDKKMILDELKNANILTTASNYDELSPELKKKGAMLAVAGANGYSPDTLLKIMATDDVMKTRTPEQKQKDKQYFINEQSKDFVKNKKATQDINNTAVYFSKAARKNAPEDGKIHNDIGDKGRALVKACPEMLCDEIQANAFNAKEDGSFSIKDKNGNVRYFKFNQDKWKTFMGICCDPSRATDDAMNILFGEKTKQKDAFLKDLNLTLQEGRDVMQMSLPSPYGETGSVKFESIIGKSNNQTSNKELNALRHMVESAGYSVDGNSTLGKRLLHIAKNIGLGGGIGLLTGGVGSLLSGAVSIAAEPLSLTGPATLNYVDNVKTTDVTKTIVGNTTFTETTTHVTAVKGTTTGDVTLNGEAPERSGNNHWKNAGNASLLGGIAGAAKGLATMRGVNAKGRSIDDVFNLTKLVEKENTENKPLELEIPQYTEVQTRKGEMTIGTEIPKLKAVAYRGPAAYNGLYRYEDGTPVNPRDFARAYQRKINGNMTDFSFFVFSELDVPGKGKIVPVEDYENEYKKIRPGQPGGKRGIIYKGTGTRKVSAQGTIR